MDNPDTARAEVFMAADGWRFRLVNKRNGQIVSVSEGYQNKADAVGEAEQLVGADDVRVVED